MNFSRVPTVSYHPIRNGRSSPYPNRTNESGETTTKVYSKIEKNLHLAFYYLSSRLDGLDSGRFFPTRTEVLVRRFFWGIYYCHLSVISMSETLGFISLDRLETYSRSSSNLNRLNFSLCLKVSSGSQFMSFQIVDFLYRESKENSNSETRKLKVYECLLFDNDWSGEVGPNLPKSQRPRVSRAEVVLTRRVGEIHKPLSPPTRHRSKYLNKDFYRNILGWTSIEPLLERSRKTRLPNLISVIVEISEYINVLMWNHMVNFLTTQVMTSLTWT